MKYYCSNCKKRWNYRVEKCIFCGQDLDQIHETMYLVIGFTQVFVPSTGNENVPYYVNLLEDKNGDKIVHKSITQHNIGDFIDLGDNVDQNYIVGIIGGGLMGTQIASFFIQNGFITILKVKTIKAREKAIKGINKIISKKASQDEVNQIFKKINVTTNLSDLIECDLIIEAVNEDFEIKTEVFKDLNKICKKSAILSTNSSSLSIDKLSSIIDEPEKLIGLHFFNPVHRMDLVEVVTGEKTSEETKKTVIDLLVALNKKPIVTNNSPGYIVNRLLLPQINEASKILELGVAKKDDIDEAMKLGLNHPMGPFKLADLIGLDVCVSILNVLSSELKDDRYNPSSILLKLVSEGKLGYKTKEGFYKY